LDPGVDRMLNEFKLFTCNDLSISYLEDVGTFDVTNPLEIRDNATASTAFGADGFNVPSLLSINYHAPYLHRGRAQTLAEMFPLHTLPVAGGQNHRGHADRARAVGSAGFPEIYRWHHRPLPLRGNVFRDALRMAGPCPPPPPVAMP
jgi:hypothetical protein